MTFTGVPVVGSRTAPRETEPVFDKLFAKYGDVVSVEETLECLEKVREETGVPK